MPRNLGAYPCRAVTDCTDTRFFFLQKKVPEASSSAKKGPNSFENLNDAVNQHNRGLDSTVQC